MKRTNMLTAATVFVTTSALLLTGCTGTSGGDSESKTLRISWLSAEAPGIEAVVAAFEKDNPDVKVKLTSADTGAYQASLRTELSSGTAADVVYAWSPSNAGGIRPLDKAGLLEDLSDEPWADEYFDSVADGARTEDGRTLLMAPLIMGLNVIYNQSALDEVGLEIPETLNEMWTYCDAAHAAGRIPYALAGAEQYGAHAAVMAIAADLVYGEDFAFDDDLSSGATTFPKNDAYVKTYEIYQKMLDSNCFPANATGINWDELMRQLATGEALGSLGSTTRLSLYQEMNPDAEFRIAGFDSDNDTGTNKEILAMQGGAAIPISGKNTELAKEFVRYLADNLGVYWAAHQGSAPTMPDKVTEGDDPNVDYLLGVLADGGNVHYLNTYWCAEAEAAMVAGNQGMIVGTQTGPQVLESMQVAYDGCK